MNLKQLQHLLAVADLGSFSQAAERHYISQSALSRSIQALERELDVCLIDRVGKHNELTPFGRVVAQRARRMVHDAGELRRSAQFLQEGKIGTLRLGLGSGPSAILMRPFLRHMACRYPGVEVSIAPGSTELQIPLLRQRVFDVLVVDMHRIAPSPDLIIEDLGSMRAGFSCRAGHPLLERNGRVSFDDMRRYPLASTPLSAEVARDLMARYGAGADPQTAVTLRCDDIPALLDVVRHSDAVFLGILAAIRPHQEAGHLTELRLAPALDAVARFAFVTLADRTEAPVVGLLRQFVIDVLHD
ncbi:LysR family transcriptional regulator [Castellaniella hirudinis]|uniref:LysR family transcriptional regulator n=1 Tax=Castellaniella hirudinis TaxID=1144617 RepID=UPI0039C365DC